MPTELWDPDLSNNDWPQIQDMDFWKKAAESVATEADTSFIRSARSMRSKVVNKLRSEYPKEKGEGEICSREGIRDHNNWQTKFAQCVGQNRQGTDEPLMPLNRMPFGLVEYQIEFFTWYLVNPQLRGPTWPASVSRWTEGCLSFPLSSTPAASISLCQKTFDDGRTSWRWSSGRDTTDFFGVLPGVDCLQTNVKIPCCHTSQKKHYVREVTVRAQETFARVDFAINTLKGPAGLDDNQIHLYKDIETIDKELALKDLKAANPKGRFSIKVDGTDIKPALQESMKGEWNGDPDLQDSRLQQLRLEYENRVKLNNIIEKERERRSLQDRIEESISHFESDSQFLKESLEKTVKVYQKKIRSLTTKEETLKELSWEIVELSHLRAIFTCTTTRAVHLEKADSLDTDSCINALRRFIARGQVKAMWSDNGTNLVGAKTELRKELEKWNKEKIKENLLQKQVDWHFSPPSGSHFGGVWERQIRTIRQVLTAIAKKQQLDDEGLHTLFCEVEQIINTRPLTTISNEVNDLEALTPNQPDSQGRFVCSASMETGPVFGRFVLEEDENTPRGRWPLGRVIEVTCSSDGLVRRAKVKTQCSVLERPVVKQYAFCWKRTRAHPKFQEDTDNNKPNLLYKFAQILSTNRPGTNIPLLQLDRMPFGLIQYQLEFYSSTNVHQIEKKKAAGKAVLGRSDLEGANPWLMSGEETDADDCDTWLQETGEDPGQMQGGGGESPGKRVLSDLPSSAATPTKVNRAYVKSRMEDETAGGIQMESDEIRDGNQGRNELDNETEPDIVALRIVSLATMIRNQASAQHVIIGKPLTRVSDPPGIPYNQCLAEYIPMLRAEDGMRNKGLSVDETLPDLVNAIHSTIKLPSPCRNILHKIWKKVEACKEEELDNLLKMHVSQMKKLEECGCDLACMAYSHNSRNFCRMGTDAGLDFLDANPDLEWTFAASVTTEKALKKKVTDARRRSSGKEKLRQLCKEPYIQPIPQAQGTWNVKVFTWRVVIDEEMRRLKDELKRTM
ncbi:hypothetical protein Bbelb_187000 [Branchiostoma belcheri]|nr:hypothetical protein Bbelb_187000 [Branchiostoma belcheri]